MSRPFVTVAVLVASLLSGSLPAPADAAGGPDDRFSWTCRFSLPEFFAGENASAAVNLTNQQEDIIAVQAVGMQLDWMMPYEHWYDEKITEPVNLTGGDSREFHMSFPVPATAPPVDHVYHVCVEYFVNRSGKMLLETFCSENRSDFRVSDFDISVSPAHRDILIGDRASFAIAVLARNGLSGPVSLDELGPGAPEHRTVVSEIAPPSAGTLNGSTLVVTTTNASALGEYSARVHAAFRDLHRYATVTFTVLGRPFFTVEVSPRSRSVEAGGTAVFKVSIRSFHNFTGNVTLSWLERPHGSSVTFRPSVFEGNGTAEMAVRTAADGETGSFLPVVFEAAGPEGALNATARLTIRPPPAVLTAPDLLLVLLAIAVLTAAAGWLARKNLQGRK